MGLHDVAYDYFTQLYKSRVLYQPLSTSSSFKALNEAMIQQLYQPVTPSLIKSALHSIGGYKTPGPSGFPAQFFKDFWTDCYGEICSFVRFCFQHGTIPYPFNKTLLVLVPKQMNITAMQHLRPISLCETLYKVVAKIIVGRLRPLHDLVDTSQTSFVPGHQISDNIIIAQEILHRFTKTKGRKGYCAWKIDLSKAYDRLAWPSIADVLFEIGIQGSFHRLIMHCITSVTYQVIINGELSQTIIPECGLRQGDPISPYIFVLCLQKLSFLISDNLNMRIWRAVKASRSGPPISHLFFADDLLLFMEASINQAIVVKHCLDQFCSASGQKINLASRRSIARLIYLTLLPRTLLKLVAHLLFLSWVRT